MPELSIADAARILGLTLDATRSRARRGVLASVRRDGRVFIVLPDEPTGHDTGDRPDQSPTSRDQSDDQSRLVAQMQGEIDHLRATLDRALDQLAEDRRRSDTILAMLSQRPPELAPPESPPATPSEPQGAVGEAGGVRVPLGAPAAVRRPWWRWWRG